MCGSYRVTHTNQISICVTIYFRETKETPDYRDHLDHQDSRYITVTCVK